MASSSSCLATEPGAPPWRPLLGLTALAVLLRAVHLACLDDPWAGQPVRDAAAYAAWAERILAGTEPARAYWADPLYAWLLAGCKLVAGARWIGLVLGLHVLLDGLSALVVGALAWRAFARREVALLAAGFAAVYEPLIVHAAVPDKSALATLLSGVATLALLRAAACPGLLAPALAGLATGVACLARPNALLLLGAAALVLLRGEGEGTGAPRGRFGRAGALLLGGLLPILPVTVRNLAVSGEPVLISANFGVNFYLGNHPANPRSGVFLSPPEIASDPLTEEEEWTREASQRVGRPLSARERESFWLRQGLAFCRADPLSFAIRTAHKAWLLVAAFEVPDNLSLELYRSFSPLPLRGPLPLLGWTLLGPLALFGLIRGLPGGQRSVWLLAGAAAVWGGSLVPFTVTARYRLPMVVCLLPFAAWGALRLVEEGRAGKRRALLVDLGLVGLLALLIQLPLVDEQSYRARDRYDLAVLRNGQARHAEALELAGQALELDPELTQAHLEAGIALARLGELAGARQAYLNATGGRADVAGLAWFNLGALELRLGSHEAARRALERAIPLLADRPEAQARARELIEATPR